jgi:hypothetical protein
LISVECEDTPWKIVPSVVVVVSDHFDFDAFSRVVAPLDWNTEQQREVLSTIHLRSDEDDEETLWMIAQLDGDIPYVNALVIDTPHPRDFLMMLEESISGASVSSFIESIDLTLPLLLPSTTQRIQFAVEGLHNVQCSKKRDVVKIQFARKTSKHFRLDDPSLKDHLFRMFRRTKIAHVGYVVHVMNRCVTIYYAFESQDVVLLDTESIVDELRKRVTSMCRRVIEPIQLAIVYQDQVMDESDVLMASMIEGVSSEVSLQVRGPMLRTMTRVPGVEKDQRVYILAGSHNHFLLRWFLKNVNFSISPLRVKEGTIDGGWWGVATFSN